MSSITSGGAPSDIDSTLKTGNTSVEHMQVDGANTSANTALTNRTIATGDSHTHANIEIPNGITWTIDSGGALYSLDNITITGTGVLIVNGIALAII